MNECQRRVEDFLSSPAAYSDGTQKPEVITTHGAKIFLGKRQVFKIKRAVNFGYMDFTTLEKRKSACKSEVELNRPNAPSIYIDVVPITKTDDFTLEIAGKGEVVEWAVQMKRYPEADVLLNVAREGKLGQTLARQLGKNIAKSHLLSKPVDISNGGERVGSILNGIFRELSDRSLCLPEETVHSFRQLSDTVRTHLGTKLDRRSELGFVRHCHGDLHLANIVMIENKAVPVDALEFDEELAKIDVLYDLAFLIMDLLHNGRRKAANQVFNSYCLHAWTLIEENGFEVLPFFLALRSAIRAMVTAQHSALDENEGPGKENEALRYLEQASEYLQSSKPRLLSIGGLSGTGKSTLAADFAPNVGDKCGALILRSDLERKQMFNADEFENLPQEAYRKSISEKVYSRMLEKARVALEQGQSVLLDAVFANHYEQLAAAQLAESLNISFHGFWLTAPEKVLIDRVRQREFDASDADETVVRHQLKTFRNIEKCLPKGWLQLDALGTPYTTLKGAVAMLDSS